MYMYINMYIYIHVYIYVLFIVYYMITNSTIISYSITRYVRRSYVIPD